MYPTHYQQPHMMAYQSMGGGLIQAGIPSYQFGDHCRSDGAPMRREALKDGKKSQSQLKSTKDTTALNEKIAENNMLKKRVMYLEGQVEKQKSNDFFTELKALSIQRYMPNQRRRESVMSHINDDAPLMKAIKALLPVAFNKASRTVLTAAKNICSNAEKFNSAKDYNLVAEDITKFNKGMADMKMEENEALFETLRNQVNLNILEIEKGSRFEKNIRPQQKQYSTKQDTFQSIVKQFMDWKKMYTSTLAHSDEGVTNVVAALDNASSFLKNLKQGISDKYPSFDPEVIRKAKKACGVEMALLREEPIIYFTLLKVRHELNQRMATIREVKHVNSVISNMGILHAPACSLLEVVNKTDGNIKPKVAFHCMQGVLDDLIALHDAGEVYIHVNPENIMVSDRGSLVEHTKAKSCEPVVPFRCMAPELKAAKEKPCTSDENPVEVKPTSACDVYSFGQVVLWLSCLSSVQSSQEIWSVMQEKMMILQDILSSEPSCRPSASQVKASLAGLFEQLFGESMDEEEDVVVEEEEEEEQDEVAHSEKGKENGHTKEYSDEDEGEDEVENEGEDKTEH